ncbi:hypothetical protein [Chryseobacterium koreense]|uniref:Uncharacterized protein n=1 Tax=Chryseobacterium koreense CCUG 49689 TaxID=1304281 RepID=A0A0J7IY96_9FLAO|nr:hypothetical protein [Chryseobacterium koreense]KMQ70806.1 hypothetical protein ACM44_09210 [Chryseobacterium koreense CCUG 49689]MBB5332555.1 hypothetical protein [Chryseobacterium koreense]
MKPEIYSSGSFATDLSQIKAIKKDYDTQCLIFEFRSQIEFRVNPETDEEEMVEIAELPVYTEPYEDCFKPPRHCVTSYDICATETN